MDVGPNKKPWTRQATDGEHGRVIMVIDFGKKNRRNFMVGPTGRAKDMHMDDMISMVGEEGVHLVIIPRITNWFRTHAVGGGGGKVCACHW